MRILVVGGGGREHALAWKLSQEAEVIAAPGNPGIAEDCETVVIPASDHQGLVALCRQRNIDLVVVGPEDPLIQGLGNALRDAGIHVFGPNADGAQLEGSKAFSKALMQRSGVPTAAFEAFNDSRKAREYARHRFGEGKQVAVKASGNALGKGVVVCSTLDEALDAIERMMVAKQFGSAGETVVVEDRLNGPEFSLMTLVGDRNFVSLPVAQDHKRALDGDEGPNTGGMGAFSPVQWIDEELIRDVERRIVAPTVVALRAKGIEYRGNLFSGIMMDGDRPHCLEFNVRMGDPETEALMLRLGDGFADALLATASGARIDAPAVMSNAAVAVVICARDYPASGSKGDLISIGNIPAGAKLFHAGTVLDGGRLMTQGGRIITAAAAAPTFEGAKRNCYAAARAVRFEGARFRSDVAAGTKLVGPEGPDIPAA